MKLRDRIIVATCNGLLRLASPRYQRLLRGVVDMGMADFERRVREFAPASKGESK